MNFKKKGEGNLLIASKFSVFLCIFYGNNIVDMSKIRKFEFKNILDK